MPTKSMFHTEASILLKSITRHKLLQINNLQHTTGLPAPTDTFAAQFDEAKLLLRPMFLGNAATSCEDNILTLIHELFTG